MNKSCQQFNRLLCELSVYCMYFLKHLAPHIFYLLCQTLRYVLYSTFSLLISLKKGTVNIDVRGRMGSEQEWALS